MFIDADDPRIRVSIRALAAGRSKLIIEYPREDRYRDLIMTALSDLLHPNGPRDPGPSGADTTGAGNG